ncbi:MAG: hypothetical protein J6I96_05120 [Oscillospiraceae bacterium]|nr:hypothetical protein [Oscillospiraceae bacterium]
MSRFEDNSITIYEAMQNISKGKYVMPAFQRDFVCVNDYDRYILPHDLCMDIETDYYNNTR